MVPILGYAQTLEHSIEYEYMRSTNLSIQMCIPNFRNEFLKLDQDDVITMYKTFQEERVETMVIHVARRGVAVDAW